MIIIMKRRCPKPLVEETVAQIKAYGVDVHISHGEEYTILGCIGDTSAIDSDKLALNNNIDRIMRVQEPFKKANRKFHPEDSVIDVSGVPVGGGKLAVIAGPCSVESEAQIIEIAERVKRSGASFIRGGAFKPRTSPYAFQGLEDEGLKLLLEAKEETGLPIVSEIMSVRKIDKFVEAVDLIQVGTRNMQNFDLLKELGRIDKPILLKRGLSSTIEEWLMSAEYIMSGGNNKVILCERGIRTFETYTRNSLDLNSIPAIKRLSHLPVIVDPSHATGHNWMAAPLSMAAIAAGADGIMVEVHNDPKNALCDGAQSITPDEFDILASKLRAIAEVVGRIV